MMRNTYTIVQSVSWKYCLHLIQKTWENIGAHIRLNPRSIAKEGVCGT